MIIRFVLQNIPCALYRHRFDLRRDARHAHSRCICHAYKGVRTALVEKQRLCVQWLHMASVAGRATCAERVRCYLFITKWMFSHYLSITRRSKTVNNCPPPHQYTPRARAAQALYLWTPSRRGCALVIACTHCHAAQEARRLQEVD
ncbi:hypothetical protein EON67_06220 [archaeon]|nr:MAG: hypothetical protein EON67_06220 [archaeon]